MSVSREIMAARADDVIEALNLLVGHIIKEYAYLGLDKNEAMACRLLLDPIACHFEMLTEVAAMRGAGDEGEHEDRRLDAIVERLWPLYNEEEG